MIVANFTKDDLEWTHIGVTGTIKSGQILEMEDNRARHILNKLEARGLLRMHFGDNPDDKAEQAQKIYTNFWLKQITDFNQDQERRKNLNREPIYPTVILNKKAKELGVELLGPWAYKPNDNVELQQQRELNSKLVTQINTLQEQMKDLVALLGDKATTPLAMQSVTQKVEMAKHEPKAEKVEIKDDPLSVAKPLDAESEGILKKVEKMKKDQFIEWVMENSDLIQDPKTSPALVNRLELKWKMAVPNTDWPLLK